MTLDQIRSNDSGDMYGLIQQFPVHLREGRQRALDASIDVDMERVRVLVLAGMGGSAIGGDLVRTLIQDEAARPMTVVRGYDLPAFVNEHALVLVSSFSGNTEETLSAMTAAQEQGAQIACITSGGEVLERARDGGFSCVQIPGGMPPRAALGYSFSVVMTLVERLGIVDEDAAGWAEAEALLDAQTEELADPSGNRALDHAERIAGTLPLVYSGPGLLEAVNLRWRGQFQENSKVYATGNLFPELNHNEIMGWEYPGDLHRQISVITLRDRGDHPRVQRRMDVTRDLLAERASSWIDVYSKGESKLARMLSLVNLGDWVSFYLAVGQDVDPTPIGLIDALKSAMQGERISNVE